MKLVVKPPNITTIRLGRPDHSASVPAAVRFLADRFAGGEAKAEAGAHDAREGGNE